MSGQLAHSPADVLRWAMISEELGTNPTSSQNWPIFCQQEPNNPDAVITTFDTQGVKNARQHKIGRTFEHHGVSIKIRAADGPTSYAKARTICLALDYLTCPKTVTINSHAYAIYNVSRKGDAIPLGRLDNSSRFTHSINVLVALTESL